MNQRGTDRFTPRFLWEKHYYFVVKLLQSSNITSGTFLLLIFLFWSVPVSAEGRVEHQKLNQVGAARPPPGWVFGVQLDYSCHKKRGVDRSVPRWFKYEIAPSMLVSARGAAWRPRRCLAWLTYSADYKKHGCLIWNDIFNTLQSIKSVIQNNINMIWTSAARTGPRRVFLWHE